MTRKELIKHLQNYEDPDGTIAYDLWCVNDVFVAAEQEDIEISKEEAEEILLDIESHKDAEQGINWETLRCGVYDVKSNREEREIE